MKTKLIIAAAISSFCIIISGGDPKPDPEIEAIKFRHKQRCDMARAGMEAGYYACQAGIPLSNAMVMVEKKTDEVLAELISDEMKRRTK